MRYEIRPFSHLYEGGGFYDDLDLLIPHDGQGPSSEVVELCPVFPMAQYVRSDYTIYSDSQEFYQTLGEIFEGVRASYTKLPATVAFEVRDGLARDAVLYVTGEDGWGVLYPTYRTNDRPSVGLIDAAAAGSDLVERLDANGRTLVYLSSAGSFNYGHWLVDDLPRLKHVLRFMKDPVTLIVQSFPGMDDIRLQSIGLICRDRDVDVHFVDPLKLIGFDRMIYVTPVSYHPFLKNPEALDYLRSTALDALGLASSKKEKIYVHRQRRRGRVLRNDALIASFLVARGFRIVDPEGLSFEEQVRIFCNAEIVVGVMCAALCNVIFSSPNITLVALAPNGWVEPFYWDLATALGHRYVAIHGARENLSPHPHLDDFSIDFGLFQRAIDEVLAY